MYKLEEKKFPVGKKMTTWPLDWKQTFKITRYRISAHSPHTKTRLVPDEEGHGEAMFLEVPQG